jgi:hypothetical protein
MTSSPLTLTADEHQFLVDLLTEVLQETRVEEHRTRTPLYRKSVVDRETIIADLLKKLGQPPAR